MSRGQWIGAVALRNPSNGLVDDTEKAARAPIRGAQWKSPPRSPHLIRLPVFSDSPAGRLWMWHLVSSEVLLRSHVWPMGPVLWRRCTRRVDAVSRQVIVFIKPAPNSHTRLAEDKIHIVLKVMLLIESLSVRPERQATLGSHQESAAERNTPGSATGRFCPTATPIDRLRFDIVALVWDLV
jgi:hypothetical protein